MKPSMTATATLLLALVTTVSGCKHGAKITKPVEAPASASAAPSSTQNARIALPPSITDVTLPTSSKVSGEVSPLGLRVYVGRKDLAMGSPPRVVASLPADAAARAAHGFDAALKRNGANDLFVKPIAEAVPKDQHEALVYVDRETPYRVLIEVLFTLGQSEVAHFHFVTTSASRDVTVGSLNTIDVDPPKAAVSLAQQAASVRLGLSLIVVKDGISIKARGGNIAPGCNDAGAGVHRAHRRPLRLCRPRRVPREAQGDGAGVRGGA
jgi:hypothetical protein